jgi:hypothetical protein
MAFILAMGALAGAIYLAMHDKPTTAVASVLAGLGIPIAAFIRSNSKQN